MPDSGWYAFCFYSWILTSAQHIIYTTNSPHPLSLIVTWIIGVTIAPYRPSISSVIMQLYHLLCIRVLHVCKYRDFNTVAFDCSTGQSARVWGATLNDQSSQLFAMGVQSSVYIYTRSNRFHSFSFNINWLVCEVCHLCIMWSKIFNKIQTGCRK